MRMSTALRLFDTPYLIAFSTIGCRSRAGSRAFSSVFRHVDLDMEAVRETGFLDVEIKALKVDLLSQGHVGPRIE